MPRVTNKGGEDFGDIAFSVKIKAVRLFPCRLKAVAQMFGAVAVAVWSVCSPLVRTAFVWACEFQGVVYKTSVPSPQLPPVKQGHFQHVQRSRGFYGASVEVRVV